MIILMLSDSLSVLDNLNIMYCQRHSNDCCIKHSTDAVALKSQLLFFDHFESLLGWSMVLRKLWVWKTCYPNYPKVFQLLVMSRRVSFLCVFLFQSQFES